MQVKFSDADLARSVACKELLLRTFGPEVGKLLMRCMCELRAVRCLGDLRKIPHIRIRETRRQKVFCLAVNVPDGPELILEPFDHVTAENLIDWEAVNEVTVLQITSSPHSV